MTKQNKKILDILKKVSSDNRLELTEIESKTVLKHVSLPIIDTYLADDVELAIKYSQNLGYPVVLKIASSDILHKIDARGVATNIMDEDEVRIKFDEIIRNAKKYDPSARIIGVTVQRHVPRGIEVIVGALRDPIFGPVVMFGMGGTWIELMKDVSFRLAPTNRDSAIDMITEIKGYPLLKKYRGGENVNIDELSDIIVKVSRLIDNYPQISEIDVNPIFARARNSVAVDARIVLTEK